MRSSAGTTACRPRRGVADCPDRPRTATAVSCSRRPGGTDLGEAEVGHDRGHAAVQFGVGGNRGEQPPSSSTATAVPPSRPIGRWWGGSCGSVFVDAGQDGATQGTDRIAGQLTVGDLAESVGIQLVVELIDDAVVVGLQAPSESPAARLASSCSPARSSSRSGLAPSRSSASGPDSADPVSESAERSSP